MQSRATRRRHVAIVPVLAILLLATRTVCGATASTPPDPARETGCSARQRDETLRALQREVLASAPREVASLAAATQPGGPLAGWRLSHGHVVLSTAGAVGVDNVRAAPPRPQLLLYAPASGGKPAEWLDFDGDDGPYRLVGWAYIAPYEHGTRPPARPCIAASEWFVHEAGWHTMDGSMRLTPGAASEPPRPSGDDVAIHFWHPRAWDLHLWLGDDGLPTVAFANPRAAPGGLALPHGAFLRMEGGALRPFS
jgi:hypothetical protein